jgi:hypothetical protein
LQVSNADKFVASVCRAFLGCQIEKAVDELNLKKKIISCHPSRLKNGTTVLSAELGNARLDGFWGKGGAIGGIASRVKSGMPVDNPDSRYRLAYGFRRPASRFHEFSQERKRMKKLAGAEAIRQTIPWERENPPAAAFLGEFDYAAEAAAIAGHHR